jgi:3-dehydroquinate synthase
VNIIKLTVADYSYNIYIEKNLLSTLGNVLRNTVSEEKVVVITDENLNRLHVHELTANLSRNGFKVFTIVLVPGEESKSFETLMSIYDKLVEYKVTRTTPIIAFGGGVVGDVTGFAASTFMRGVPFIQIPTTLLAQVDSSIGGKVAVNHKYGKNLIGSFYQPKAVYIDPGILSTLPQRYFNDGMSEVIKYGAIKDESLFYDLLKKNNEVNLLESMDEIIAMCCSIKKDVVEADEKDLGERMLLNFGHTLGHAIEKYYNYSKFSHGEAVAIGMSSITHISEEMGITEKGTAGFIDEILMKYNLPCHIPELDTKELMDFILLDKKNTESHINLILLEKIGKSFIYKMKKNELKSFFKA